MSPLVGDTSAANAPSVEIAKAQYPIPNETILIDEHESVASLRCRFKPAWSIISINMNQERIKTSAILDFIKRRQVEREKGTIRASA
jgi:hypothetical protein